MDARESLCLSLMDVAPEKEAKDVDEEAIGGLNGQRQARMTPFGKTDEQ